MGRRILAFAPPKLIHKLPPAPGSSYFAARSRYFSRFYANKYDKQEGNLEKPFKLRGEISKILLKTRLWKSESIIQGIRIHYNDGRIRNVGVHPDDKPGPDFQSKEIEIYAFVCSNILGEEN